MDSSDPHPLGGGRALRMVASQVVEQMSFANFMPGIFGAAVQSGAWVLIRKWAVANDGRITVEVGYEEGLAAFRLSLSTKEGGKLWEGEGQTLQAVCMQAVQAVLTPGRSG